MLEMLVAGAMLGMLLASRVDRIPRWPPMSPGGRSARGREAWSWPT